jgi:APA family basic amino acid/polyamine antiporter
MPRPYKAIGYPVIPGLYMVAAAGIAVILLFAKPAYSVAGLFVVLLGIPIYFIWRKRVA